MTDMDAYLVVLLQAVAEPVTAALLHSLWQGALIAGALAVALAFLRGGAARLRYAITYCALVVMLASALLTVAVVAGRSTTAAHLATTPAAITASSSTSGPVSAGMPESASESAWAASPALRSGIFLAWLLGVFSFSLVHLGGWRQVHRLTRLGSREAPAEWRERLARLSGRMGVRRKVRLLESAVARVPAVVGCVRPVILVPASAFTGLSVQHLELVLAHELAHVRRHDVLLNYLQVATEALFFFHPAAWWISNRIRVEREHCCDDLVVGMGDPRPYARALEMLERLRGSSPALAQAADGTPLLARIRRLVAQPERPGGRAATGLAGLLVLWLGLGGGLAGLGGLSPAMAAPETIAGHGVVYSPAAGDYHGKWGVEEWKDGVHIRASFRSDRSSTNFRLDGSDLSSWSGGGEDGLLVIERDAGTFYFEGRPERTAEGYVGSGTCHFRPDPTYMDELARLGISGTSADETFTFAIHGVSLEFAGGLVAAGLGDISLSQLLEFHIHGVSPAFVEDLTGLGYSGLSGRKLVEMRIHGVSPDYIRELEQLGYREIPVSRLVEMRIHGVSPDYIRELEQLGYRDVATSRLVAMRIHGVSASFIRKMQEEGRGDLSPERLIELKIHGY
jgi:beta-lactamase regulating signal transducer with metallopeptidase domain